MFNFNKTETLCKCKICGKPLYTDNLTYASNPPKNKYWCESCGWVGYLTGDEDKDFYPTIQTTPETKPMEPIEVPRQVYNSLRDRGLLRPDVVYAIKEEKLRTVLSVRDFAILYQLVSDELRDLERYILTTNVDRETIKHNPCYQDLLRIREKLGGLNIEIETPSVEVE